MQAEKRVEHEYIHSLVESVKYGDREAFMGITRLYQRKVFLLAYSYFYNKEDALDIVQETFLRFYQKAHMFKKGKNFQNWLLQIAKNICIDYYRKHHSKGNEWGRKENIEDVHLPSHNQGHSHSSSDLREIISRCLEKLSERQRMIFVMKHYNQLQYNEIAQILNIASGTVKSLHFKAVRNLRTLMSPYMGRIG
ncbi:MAG: RNA polymerase sigma factor [Candidatus Aminicenantes bacterium]|nr:RNA polymerase sigma factor [Candidatus Aminicenantes bacterium]MDH5383751.1 RNA polymerase sigma factor [Candidatus Aminicenantes bacterium]MDH5742330.1 RNA polymerase sigma factor [Candidatus Aminicenantes bacterium]